MRVAPYAQYVREGGFARPAGRPWCRCPDLLTALASRAGKARSSAGRARCPRFRGGGGVRGRAPLMGGGYRNAACLGRPFRGRRPLGLRASARPRAPKPGLPRPGKRPKQPFFPDLCPSRGAPLPPLPPPARARIVLPRAAPQPMRPREPREPDTAEDAGGQTDHSGQAFQGGLGKDTSFHKPPSFMSSLNPFT